MVKSLLRLLMSVVFCGLLAACAGGPKKPKSSVHIHAGESPTMHYSDEPEAAGGPLSSS